MPESIRINMAQVAERTSDQGRPLRGEDIDAMSLCLEELKGVETLLVTSMSEARILTLLRKLKRIPKEDKFHLLR